MKSMTVEQYRKRLIAKLGFASPILVNEYAEHRIEEKRKQKEAAKAGLKQVIFSNDCKGCKKEKEALKKLEQAEKKV